jgi:hypothetical protein
LNEKKNERFTFYEHMKKFHFFLHCKKNVVDFEIGEKSERVSETIIVSWHSRLADAATGCLRKRRNTV